MFGWLRGKRHAVIRAARSSDSPALPPLHAQGFDRAWGVSEFEALIADGSVIGHVCGYGRAAPFGFILSRRAADEAEILSIVIDRRERGKGQARALLIAHIQTLAALRVRRLFLEVEVGNEPAIRLYRGLDFEEVGRRKSYYRKADGRTADALIMARPL